MNDTQVNEPAWHAEARAMGWRKNMAVGSYVCTQHSGAMIAAIWLNGPTYRCDACMRAEVEAHEKTPPEAGAATLAPAEVVTRVAPSGGEIGAFNFAGVARTLCGVWLTGATGEHHDPCLACQRNEAALRRAHEAGLPPLAQAVVDVAVGMVLNEHRIEQAVKAKRWAVAAGLRGERDDHELAFGITVRAYLEAKEQSHE